MPARALQQLRDLSLKGKITVTLTGVFTAIVTVFLVGMLPVLREQRVRLLDQNERLLSTLHDSYQRRFIHDLLSENADSLAINAAALARQSGILWVRIEAEGQDLMATADPAIIARVLRSDTGGEPLADGVALLVQPEGRASLVDAAGRSVSGELRLEGVRAPGWRRGVGTPQFFEAEWDGATALYFTAELRGGGQSFGWLHILYSLAALRRTEYLTHTVPFAVVATSFVALLVLLNLVISRMVIGPVRRILAAMREASKGALEVRLPVHSRDEIGTIAESFNSMVEELSSSKREIEDHSRNLETRVENRTRELRSSEAKLLEVKNHLATVIANVATGVISLDQEGRITTFNERSGEILSVHAQSAEGRLLEEVLAECEDRGLVEFIAPVRQGRSGLRKGQVFCRLPQGRRTLSVVASTLHGEGRDHLGTVVVFDDVTQLLATQRLETWKQAVERVIHEIKNPLTPIGLAAQTLRTAYEQDRSKFDEIFPSAAEMILSSVQDLKGLITEFTRFSRLPKAQLRRQDLNALVDDVLTPYEHGAAGGAGAVGLRRQLAQDLPAIDADADQLKRVLLNVVNNAVEAMEETGGELTVSTEGSHASGQVRVSVRDRGPGVEDPERIFEPHYTTKVKGAGLGLAIARQIVLEHGGEIRVETEIGSGTTITIVLPAARRA